MSMENIKIQNHRWVCVINE
uniref:Uncharacterized protein n=1 Tax=Rhizophora mucronata TaxID=61149 RepID=A0A2P2J5R2_RHIMU